VRPRLEGFGLDIVGDSPEDMARRMREDGRRLARVIRESGAKQE
jgi:hypothetical protein